jgi:hypothetical protein
MSPCMIVTHHLQMIPLQQLVVVACLVCFVTIHGTLLSQAVWQLFHLIWFPGIAALSVLLSSMLSSHCFIFCVFSGSRNVKVGKINESHPHDEQMPMLWATWSEPLDPIEHIPTFLRLNMIVHAEVIVFVWCAIFLSVTGRTHSLLCRYFLVFDP